MARLTVRLFVSHPLAAGACRQFLRGNPDIRITRSERFDVGIVDAGDSHCLPILLRDTPPGNATMLVLVKQADEHECLRWLVQGARGVLDYERCGIAGELARAVRNAAGGQMVVPPKVALRWLLAEHHPQPRALRSGFTARETEIVRLALAGLTNQEIAGALHLSVPAIKSHLSHVYTKADIHSRAALAALA